MRKSAEFAGKPVMYVCSSGKQMEELIGKSKELSGEEDFILLLDYNSTDAARVLPAYVNALIRQKDGIARSRSTWMEMLLLVAGTMNIGKAIKEHGAKNPERFLAFATSEGLIRRFAAKNGVRLSKKISLAIDENVSGGVALTEVEND